MHTDAEVNSQTLKSLHYAENSLTADIIATQIAKSLNLTL
jgi:hypothetical protein